MSRVRLAALLEEAETLGYHRSTDRSVRTRPGNARSQQL